MYKNIFKFSIEDQFFYIIIISPQTYKCDYCCKSEIRSSIKNYIISEDIEIRWGGDEFLIILFNQDQKSANTIVNRIRKEINKRNATGAINTNIGADIVETADLEDCDYLIRVADEYLCKEKETKKEHNKIKINNLKDLIEDIERVRDKLNKQILNEYENINNREILELSRELDKLILKYIKIMQE